MNSSWKAIVGVILIFFFGCATGWLSRSVLAYHQTVEFLQRGPEGAADVLERRLTRNLNLDPNQRQQIHACMLANVDQRKMLQLRIQPQVQMLNRQTLQQINSILQPDQREKLHENIELFRKRFGRGVFNPGAEMPPPGTPPPGAPPPTQSANPSTQ